jgi:hypothetical protein
MVDDLDRGTGQPREVLPVLDVDLVFFFQLGAVDVSRHLVHVVFAVGAQLCKVGVAEAFSFGFEARHFFLEILADF